jgi:diguanylate cyclase (GGDEF)-like protein
LSRYFTPADWRASAPGLRIAWMLGISLLIAGVGWVDANVEPDIAFSLLYLLPVVAVAWRWGFRFAVAAACLSGSARFTAALLGRGLGMLPMVLWNSMNHLLVFLATGLVVALLRREREHLADLLSRESGLARTDPITGLPNWRSLVEHLRREISRSRRHDQPLCIGYLDLDNFKRVNDKYGHGTGDELLAKIGDMFRESVRPEDLVARVGGDEFVLIFNSPDPASAEQLGLRVISEIETLGQDLPECRLGASLGIVCFHPPPERPEDLVTQADQTMYQAKKKKKGTIRVVVIKGKSVLDRQPGWWAGRNGVA